MAGPATEVTTATAGAGGAVRDAHGLSVSKHFGDGVSARDRGTPRMSPPAPTGWHMDITWVDDPPKVAF